MSRIRILQAVAGVDFSWLPGDEIELPGEEAAKWADGVRGEALETAVARPGEQRRRGRPPKAVEQDDES